MVVFGQKRLYSGKVVVFGQSGCISTEVVVSGQSGCIRVKWFYLGKGGCIRAKWLYIYISIYVLEGGMLRPMDVLDASKHVCVCSVKVLLLTCFEGPCFCSVEENMLDKRFKDVNFRFIGEG